MSNIVVVDYEKKYDFSRAKKNLYIHDLKKQVVLFKPKALKPQAKPCTEYVVILGGESPLHAVEISEV